MSKRKSSVDHGAAAKRPAKQEQQFLYLVLDDWENGYSVRKLDMDVFQQSDDHEPEPFTEPPLARFDVTHGYSHSIVAHGTKIVAMKPHESSPAIPAFDTATSAVGILPWPEFHMDFGLPLVISMAGKLFLFIYTSYYLGDPPAPPPPLTVYPPPEKQPWAWTTIRSPLPFNSNCILGYAVHPDGRTLFVSADRFTSDSEKGTFSFDTKSLEWTRQGDWLLPFSGQAHYVAELDAWVGLCRHKGGIGHLCSSDVVPLDDAAGQGRRTTLPRWRILVEDRLFHRESPLHLGAKLVYMGGTRFCVVQTMWHKDDDDARRKAKETVGYVRPPRVVICITSFAVEYDEGGELRLKSRLLARRCKVFERAHEIFDISGGAPLAFWI